MQRLSRLVTNPRTGDNVFEAADSPLVLAHAAFVGLGISSPAATVTVGVDVIKTGDFDTEITLLGTTYLYPDADGANALYHCAWVKITFDDDIQIFQKG